MTRFQTIALGLAGVTATGIGAALALTPAAFLAGSGIMLGSEPSLLSELRAPGAGLTMLGLVMLGGLVRPSLAPTALIAAVVVYAGFPAGRLVGLVLDGRPSGAILAALAAELAIAALLALAFLPRRPAIRAA